MFNTNQGTIKQGNAIRRALIGMLAGSALAAAITLTGTASASATGVDFDGYGINIHTEPTIYATVVGQGNRGDGLFPQEGTGNGSSLWCSKYNRYDTQWWRIRDLRTGVIGWINNCYATGV